MLDDLVQTETCGLYYKNIVIINYATRVVSECCHNLEHHFWSLIILLESSFLLLELSIMLLEMSIIISYAPRVVNYAPTIVNYAPRIVNNAPRGYL
jgi:hypothetical protein